MLHTTLAVLALAAIALALAGCGKSSKTESTATSAATTSAPAQTTSTQPATTTAPVHEIKLASGAPLARSVWIAKGDAICARAHIVRNAQTAKTEADIVRLVPRVAGYDHLEAVELGRLVPPAGMASDWKVLVNDAQEASELVAKLGEYAAAKRYSRDAQPILAMARRLLRQTEAVAGRDGFKKCSAP